MEDYEKKYKQLHKFITDLYPHMSEYCKEKVEGFFPELRESEEETIRKEIIDFIKENIIITEEQRDIWLAWLEKQDSIGNINEKLRQYREYLVEETERWHKKEEDETHSKAGKQDCIGHANAYISARAKFEDLFNYDSWLERQVKQKPAWSEEDETFTRDAVAAVEEYYTKCCGQEELVVWLKSLKDRYTWKPSDEQIEMLENVRKILHANEDIYSKANNLMYDFEELIRTLTKLKGE